LSDKDRFRYIELKIGILVSVVLVFSVAALLYVGYQKDLFAKKIRYYAYSSTGERLYRGIPVKFQGFRMGEVTDVELNDDGIIVLTLTVLEKYKKWVRSDSRVFFNQESIIGNPYLRFTAGSPDRPEMPENSIFILEFEGGIDEIIKQAKPVMEDLRKIVENIRILSDELSSEKGSFRKFLSSMERVGYQLEHGEGAIPFLVHDRTSREKVSFVLDRLEEVETGMIELGTSLNAAVTEKLNPLLDDLSAAASGLPALRRKVDYTLDLGDDLLLKLNNTWPLAPDIKRKERPELPAP